MTWLTVPRLASWLLAPIALVAVAGAADADVSWDENRVLGIQGELVPAGEPVMIYTNVSNSKYANGGFEKMEIYLNAQGEQNSTKFFPDVYCEWLPCLALFARRVCSPRMANKQASLFPASGQTSRLSTSRFPRMRSRPGLR